MACALLALAGAALTPLSGCKRSAPDPDAELIRANTLEAEPSLERSLRLGLASGVIYLGNEIDATRARPGGSITITHYLSITGEPPPGALFIGLGGGDLPARPQPPSPMQRVYPPDRWKPGVMFRDRQVIEIPPDWPADEIEVIAGFGDQPRATIARAAIERDGLYAVHRASSPIAIDGDPSDPAWRAASWSPRFVTAKGGRDLVGSARARLLWDDEHLYVLVEVIDDAVYSPYTGRDDPLWKADVVEIFIDADRNRRGYVELQVNPRGAIFDAFFPIGRGQKHHFEWDSAMKAGVRVDGSADAETSRDRGWVVEMAIPHGDVRGMATDMAVEIPPRPGDRWNLNVVRVDKPAKSGISAATWNPITIRDFHALSRMLTVTFAP